MKLEPYAINETQSFRRSAMRKFALCWRSAMRQSPDNAWMFLEMAKYWRDQFLLGLPLKTIYAKENKS